MYEIYKKGDVIYVVYKGRNYEYHIGVEELYVDGKIIDKICKYLADELFDGVVIVTNSFRYLSFCFYTKQASGRLNNFYISKYPIDGVWYTYTTGGLNSKKIREVTMTKSARN